MHLPSFGLFITIALILMMNVVNPALAQTSKPSTNPGSIATEPQGDFPLGTLVILNKGEASVSLIHLDETGGGKVVATVPVGEGPHEVAIAPNGQSAVVCNYGQRTPGNTLSIIDLPTKKMLRTINLGPYERPHGIQFLSDGRRVFITSEVAKTLIEVNLLSARVINSIETLGDISHMVVLNPAENRAFVANLGSASISVLDLDLNINLKVIPTGKGAEALDISPDGHEVWVGNRDDNNITIVDPYTLEVVHTMPCPRFPIRCKFTPDGKHVLVSNAASGDVAIFDVATRKEIKRLSMEIKAVELDEDRLFGDRFGDSPVPVGILIPPDGKHAYVACTNADIVTVIDLKAMEICGRLVAGKEPDGLGWSPLEVN